MLTKTPKQPLPHWPPLWPDKTHKVQDGDNWWSLAEKYGRKDPWDIIQFNFNTHTAEEVNYYLAQLVGCTRSNDGKNYSFSSADSPGVLYIPPRTWNPAQGPYCKTDWKEYFRGTLYGTEADDRTNLEMPATLVNRLNFVEVPKLPVPCEYDYHQTVYVRPQRVDFSSGWIRRECVHIAAGPLGRGRHFTAEADAIAWIKIHARWNLQGQYSKVPFPFHETRQGTQHKPRIWQAAGVYRAMQNTFAREQRFRELVDIVRQDPDCIRRLAGRPPA